MLYLNYYLSFDVCLSVCLSVCLRLSVCVCEKLFLLYGFGEQTSRILEFKPEGLEGYIYIFFFLICSSIRRMTTMS